MSTARRSLGFSWPVLVGLAALAAPRVVLHDLGVIEEGSVVNGLFVFVPPVCWIAVVLWKRPPRPFATVVVIGVLYGVFLAVGHQVLWAAAFAGDPPVLGGNLAGIDPATQEVVLRTAAVLSSLVTGALVGVVTAVVTTALRRALRRLVPTRWGTSLRPARATHPPTVGRASPEAAEGRATRSVDTTGIGRRANGSSCAPVPHG
ncbi:hypothetical protein OF117_10890 [Geodermatophilus sp. YIM 151500]|uniref:hypothetical protein n=1 Tax=Geodermatophilus sp. YIM 151500 TaxID=2984531 RepID=UPI0021E4B01C|nr:hypothetical protein [Geodermatophilus sp. YIM 151500]MCV2489868.1 hypothetical protein [Geodermatophilus sp. YIM 151500]